MARGQHYESNGGVFGTPMRRKIFRIIKEHAKMTYSELVRELGIKGGGVQYHLAELERCGVLIKGEKEFGGKRPYRISGDYLNVNPQET